MTSTAAAPRVTVLLPVHNAGPYLRPALDSILAQTMPDLELLVVNDGSTDGSREILASCSDPRLRISDNERRLGLTASLNRGLHEARAELIARQDADDVSHPRRLELQLAFLEAHPDVSVVGSQAWIIDAKGRTLLTADRACEHDSLRWELLFDNGFFHTSVLFRRSVIREALGGYDESFAYCQDRELWSRVIERGRVANLEERLVECRVHGSSMTETMRLTGDEENRRILTRSSRTLLGEPLSASDQDLLLRFRSGLTPESLRDLLVLMRRLATQYRVRFPLGTSTSDFRRTVARQYASLLFGRVARSDPRLVLRVLAEGTRHSPLPRAILATLGAFVRARLRRTMS